MANYIENFLERNKSKSFVTNLLRYNKLDYYAKCKCISSFLTHLIIDLETNIATTDEYVIQTLAALNNIILRHEDTFMEIYESWLRESDK